MDIRWNGYDIPIRVRTKFHDYQARGRFNAGKDITHYLWRSTERSLPSAYRHALAAVLDLKEPRDITVRESKAADHFTLNFVIYRNRVVELVTHDSIRKISQRWLRQFVVKPYGEPLGMTLLEIYKFKNRKKIQGGLIKQERQPRDRWKNV